MTLFLQKYKIKAISSNVDTALYHLLILHIDKLPSLDDPHWFHKSFRQTDVIDDGGHSDIAIWCLLSESTIFWDLVAEERE